MSAVNSRLIGEEGSSVKAECLYSERYRYLIFPFNCFTVVKYLTNQTLQNPKTIITKYQRSTVIWSKSWVQPSLTNLWLLADRESEKKWCWSGDWSSCLSTGSEGSYEDTSVTIDDDRTGAFTVTLKKLQMKDTGWYWCSAGQQQIAVHLLVTPRPTTSRWKNSPPLIYYLSWLHVNFLYSVEQS